MRTVQGPRLAAVETLAGVSGVEQIEVADLRALAADDAEEMAGGHRPACGIARRHHDRLYPFEVAAQRAIGGKIPPRQGVDRVADDRPGRPAGIRTCRRSGTVSWLPGCDHQPSFSTVPA